MLYIHGVNDRENHSSPIHICGICGGNEQTDSGVCIKPAAS